MKDSAAGHREVRAYFWEDRVIGPWRMRFRKLANRRPSRHFVTGNAGDLFAGDVIRHAYQAVAVNRPDEGKRLLCIGSVAHKILPGDVVCGIGTKGVAIPSPTEAPCRIYGLRGPITLDAFRKAGHDTSNVRFLLDPGLLIRFMVDSLPAVEPRDVIYIPHYRRRFQEARRLPKGIRFVDIDASPLRLAQQILSAKFVYASSLHGIIFSHALSRPCMLVQPPSDEPFIKYVDYFTSVGLDTPKPIDDISNSRLIKTPDSPAPVSYRKEDFVFPSFAELADLGVATQGAGAHK